MDFDAYLTDQNQQGHFSGSVLVTQNGQTIFNSAYGLANHATGQPNTPQTAFQIASVSKQFTAAAILLLQDQGKLSVQDHIQTWIPNFPAEWEPITIHHLLTHTSGLEHWHAFTKLNLYAPTTREDMLRIFAELPLKFSPGAGWSYSSPAFVLLAHIVEQITGEPYAAFLQRQIFQPLGLADTGVGSRAPRPEQQALGYKAEQPQPSFELETVGIGAGDIWSTTHDLARWDAALATPGLLLSEAALRAMFTPHADMGQEGEAYGYAWYFAEIEGQYLRFHTGDNAGFKALNMQVPDHQITIVLLSNDENSDLEKIFLSLLTGLVSG